MTNYLGKYIPRLNTRLWIQFIAWCQKRDEENEDGKLSMLVSALGQEAENILSFFTFVEKEDESQEDVVLAKFDSYFILRSNIFNERACFNQRGQRALEPAETFIRVLNELSEHCDFGTKCEEHIRDQIVVGILDKDLSQRLQLIQKLTLEMTIQEVPQSEEVKVQVNKQGERPCEVQEEAW